MQITRYAPTTEPLTVVDPAVPSADVHKRVVVMPGQGTDHFNNDASSFSAICPILRGRRASRQLARTSITRTALSIVALAAIDVQNPAGPVPQHTCGQSADSQEPNRMEVMLLECFSPCTVYITYMRRSPRLEHSGNSRQSRSCGGLLENRGGKINSSQDLTR